MEAWQSASITAFAGVGLAAVGAALFIHFDNRRSRAIEDDSDYLDRRNRSRQQKNDRQRRRDRVRWAEHDQEWDSDSDELEEVGRRGARRGSRRKPARQEEDFEDTPPAPVARRGSLVKSRRRSLASPNPSRFDIEEETQELMTITNEQEGAGTWEGFSMKDAMIQASITKAKVMSKTPSDVLQELQRGNARFWGGKSIRPDASAFERRTLIMQQFPSVAILGCSDSRVPIEIVFDQGLGDIFVIRVAGNALAGWATKGSMEYAVHHLKVKVLVVMGHEGCGAVKAAQSNNTDIQKESPMLAKMLMQIKKDLDEDRLFHIRDARAHDREAVVTNVRAQVERLTQDAAIMQKVHDKELIIVGAFYEISSGIVDFFHEVSDLASTTGKGEAPSKGVQNRLMPTPTQSPQHTPKTTPTLTASKASGKPPDMLGRKVGILTNVRDSMDSDLRKSEEHVAQAIQGVLDEP